MGPGHFDTFPNNKFERETLFKVSPSVSLLVPAVRVGRQWTVLLLKHNQWHGEADFVVGIEIAVDNVRRRIEIAALTRTTNKPVAAVLPFNQSVPIGSIRIVADILPGFPVGNSLCPLKSLLNPVSLVASQIFSKLYQLTNIFTSPSFLRHQGLEGVAIPCRVFIHLGKCLQNQLPGLFLPFVFPLLLKEIPVNLQRIDFERNSLSRVHRSLNVFCFSIHLQSYFHVLCPPV